MEDNYDIKDELPEFNRIAGIPIQKKKGKKMRLFDVWETPESQREMRKAIRESIIFMEKFGAGAPPRMHGEYYTPGTGPNAKDTGAWLNLATAASYVGVTQRRIANAGADGKIEKRVYRKIGRKCYYEYKVSSLDEYIKRHHL